MKDKQLNMVLQAKQGCSGGFLSLPFFFPTSKHSKFAQTKCGKQDEQKWGFYD